MKYRIFAKLMKVKTKKPLFCTNSSSGRKRSKSWTIQSWDLWSVRLITNKRIYCNWIPDCSERVDVVWVSVTTEDFRLELVEMRKIRVKKRMDFYKDIMITTARDFMHLQIIKICAYTCLKKIIKICVYF